MPSPRDTTPPPFLDRRPSRPSVRSSISSIGIDTSLSPSDISISSLASLPPHSDHQIPAEATQAHLHLGPPYLKLTPGFASARVGLGSPKLELPREWMTAPRKSSRSPDREPQPDSASTVQAEGKPVQSTLVDRLSGLPSPPGTNSDVGAPSIKKARGLKEDMALQPPVPQRSSSSDVHRHSRHSSTPNRSPSLTSSTSSAHRSNAGLRETILRSRGSPSVSSTSLTSHAPGASATPNAQGSPSKRSSLNISQSGSPKSPRVPSPQKHERSPSLPLDRSSNASHSSSRQKSPRKNPLRNDAVNDGPPSPERNVDDRIRDAEEKIRNVWRPQKLSVDVENRSPVRGSMRRHDSYDRVIGNPGPAASHLRRSATLTSSSPLLHHDDAGNSQTRKQPYESTPHKERKEGERTSGSGSSGRRKALPVEFRSGGGLFTPSPPKQGHQRDHSLPVARSVLGDNHYDSSPQIHTSPVGHRYEPAPRSDRNSPHITSPTRSRVFTQVNDIEGLERRSSLDTRRLDRWTDSAVGLPTDRQPLDRRGLPLPHRLGGTDRQRAESVMEGHAERYRYATRGGSTESALTERAGTRGYNTLSVERSMPLSASSVRSRLASVAPGDSVSAVGYNPRERPTSAGSKNPLDVLNQIERKREEHNRQWEVDRSASVMGDPRPMSRFDRTPANIRPTTSLSSVRDAFGMAPRTAPIEPFRLRRDLHTGQTDSPSLGRGSSRMGYQPSTEPRPMRSSTSLGGRSSASMELAPSSSEHGRLLVEAFKNMEARLPQENIDLLRAFLSCTRSTESVNMTLRSAVQLASQISVHVDLEDPRQAREEFSKLAVALREAGRGSDQNVRDLTQIMLELPRLFRGLPSSTSMSTLRVGTSGRSEVVYDPIKPYDGPSSSHRMRAYSPERQNHGIHGGTSGMSGVTSSPLSPYDSRRENRRSADILRPTTSADYSPSNRYSLDSRNPRNALSGFVSKLRITPHSRKNDSPSSPSLQTIDASPPNPQLSKIPDAPIAPRSPIVPDSPRRLRHKDSMVTVKGGTSNFLPTVSKGTTTAISTVTAITANAGDMSPTRARSIRSFVSHTHSNSLSGESVDPSSIGKSFHTAEPSPREFDPTPGRLHGEQGNEDQRVNGEEGVGNGRTEEWVGSGSHEIDAVALLEHRLAEAARQREEAKEKRQGVVGKFQTWRGARPAPGG
ncbi:hypothetical protein M231_00038 [Tremella mesenterica]|uniref:Uncharacterized protein n=1 Tax=Tremella mesenterica TaxID=5217 RepID=A0A4Q1BWD6_TREME|nr:hypothetical protein M231_00038 [Tremella mesenterica]